MSLVPGVVEGVLDVDGLPVRWFDSAAGTGPTLVMVHGSGGPAEADFWALFPMLAFTRRVVTFDLTLPPADEELTLDYFVTQTRRVAEHLAPGERVALLGYSLGAVVAAATAGRFPDLVSSLVLLNGWLRTDRHQLLRNGVWRTLHDEGSAALGHFALYTAYSQGFLVGRTPWDYAALLERAGTRRTSPRVMELNRGIDIAADCAAVTAPTLVVGSTDDQMVPPRHGRELFGAIADSRYAEVHSGHAIVQERPAEVFVLVDRFLADPAAAPAGSVLAAEPV